jgi:uncharacterized protein with HEPN domain
MPPKTDDRLRDIIEGIGHVEVRTAGKSLTDFRASFDLQLMVERLLLIVCEASHRLPEELKSLGTEIDWRGINNFGNRLRHAYHTIESETVWNIVIADLPRLKAFAEAQRRAGSHN